MKEKQTATTLVSPTQEQLVKATVRTQHYVRISKAKKQCGANWNARCDPRKTHGTWLAMRHQITVRKNKSTESFNFVHKEGDDDNSFLTAVEAAIEKCVAWVSEDEN